MPRWRLKRKVLQRRRQHFTRQREIDRPLWLTHREIDCAVNRVLQHFRVGKLVIPLHKLAQHGALIAHFLRPVNFARALAHQRAFLAERRAARGHQNRHIAAPRVHDRAYRIGGAHIHMHHHQLRLAGLQVIAKRHRNCDILVRHGDGLGNLDARGFRLRQSLDQRSKIRAGVGEEIVNAAIRENCQISIGHGPSESFPGHVNLLKRMEPYTRQPLNCNSSLDSSTSRATSR